MFIITLSALSLLFPLLPVHGYVLGYKVCITLSVGHPIQVDFIVSLQIVIMNMKIFEDCLLVYVWSTVA
jgi:hypothetical protein